MTTDKVLEIVQKWGLEITLRDGQLHLVGPDLHKHRIKVLLKVLHYHKDRILDRLQPKSPSGEVVTNDKRRECRWANGFVGRHDERDSWPPVGAREWRYADQEAWQSIPDSERAKLTSSSWVWKWPAAPVSGNHPAEADNHAFMGYTDGQDGRDQGSGQGERAAPSSQEVAAEIREMRSDAFGEGRPAAGRAAGEA